MGFNFGLPSRPNRRRNIDSTESEDARASMISQRAYNRKVSLEGTFEDKTKELEKRDKLKSALSMTEQGAKDKAQGKRVAATVAGNLEGQRISNTGKYEVAMLDTPLNMSKAKYYDNEARVSGLKADDAQIGLKYADAFYKKASTGAPQLAGINTQPPETDPLVAQRSSNKVDELLQGKKKGRGYRGRSISDTLSEMDINF